MHSSGSISYLKDCYCCPKKVIEIHSVTQAVWFQLLYFFASAHASTISPSAKSTSEQVHAQEATEVKYYSTVSNQLPVLAHVKTQLWRTVCKLMRIRPGPDYLTSANDFVENYLFVNQNEYYLKILNIKMQILEEKTFCPKKENSGLSLFYFNCTLYFLQHLLQFEGIKINYRTY
ncbi:hypothetical protein CDAR_229841 [Caerostris darwini]|uniref:Uncharacterized protein n=1 Tax=Caerostris darwini TaxID=1538125 RepID=A0AAV4PZE7_9ARAC|nr:hypothetical protein CDAR_229841 [Caerostris darwini]